MLKLELTQWFDRGTVRSQIEVVSLVFVDGLSLFKRGEVDWIQTERLSLHSRFSYIMTSLIDKGRL